MIAGIVAEFNPFHNGHKFIIEEIKNEYHPECIVCAMSPDFTMRGEVAVHSKMDRTKIAIENGIDLVLEIPTPLAVESADNYASAALLILSEAKVSDLFFGIEKGDMNDLERISDIMESDEYHLLLEKYLSHHYSFQKSSLNAVREIDSDLGSLMECPNIALALEYIRANRKLNLGFSLHPILRKSSGYFDSLVEESNIQSATEIRKRMENSQDYSSFIPYEDVHSKAFTKNIYSYFKMSVLRMSADELRQIKGVNEGIEYAIKESVKFDSYDEFVSSLISKRNREVKIKRIIIYILLNIKKNDSISLSSIRALGFDIKGQSLLKELKDSDVQFITRIKKGLDDFQYLEVEYSQIRSLFSSKKIDLDILYSPVIIK